MAFGTYEARVFAVRVAVVAALVAFYVVLGFFVRIGAGSDAVYTHFAYVPIAVAGIWWARRGLAVVPVVAAVTIIMSLAYSGSAVIWHDLGRIVFFVAVGVCVAELSARVRAREEALGESEEKYRLIVEKSLSGIVIYELEGERIRFANARAADMLGYSPRGLVGTSIWDVIAREDEAKVRELVALRKSRGFTDLHYETRLARSDGSIVWADIVSSVAAYEGRRAVLVNMYDITARKDAERHERELAEIARTQEDELVHSTRLAEIGEMAAAMAHELNQPLTGIRNFARNALFMMEENAGGPRDVAENLRLISEQVDRAARIINAMRETTRKSRRMFGPVDVNGMVRESVDFLTPQLKLTGVEVKLDLADDLPKVMGDRIRLEQVFLNLVANARHAMTDSPERRLIMRTGLEPGAERPLVVEIIDTGTGFSAEQSKKLFTPFYSTKDNESYNDSAVNSGKGIGLFTVYQLVHKYNGRVDIKSTRGIGTKVTVHLPMQSAD